MIILNNKQKTYLVERQLVDSTIFNKVVILQEPKEKVLAKLYVNGQHVASLDIYNTLKADYNNILKLEY